MTTDPNFASTFEANNVLSGAPDNLLSHTFITTLPERKRRGARLRKSTPKVRSGCKTCKDRKVKCDETKPECLNCQRLKDTTCGGYDAPAAWIFQPQGEKLRSAPNPTDSSDSPDSPASDDYAVIRTDDLDIARKAFYDLRTISTSFGTSDESRSFAYYMNIVAPIMSRHSEPYFWSSLLTKAAWQHESIKYGVLAVSQVDEANGLARRPHLVTNINPLEVREKALQNYSAAVRALMRQPQAEIEAILLSCICLFTFENFMGDLQNATKHMEGAISMMETWKRQQMHSGRRRGENVVMAKHIIPILECGQRYHSISLKAGKSAVKVSEASEPIARMKAELHRRAK